MPATMIITGDARTNAKLALLDKKIARSYTSKASRYAMKVLLGKVKSATPVDSGDLRASLKVKAIKRSRSRVGVRITTGQSEKGFIGKQFYGSFVELGTRNNRQTKVGAGTGGIEAQHFMKGTVATHRYRIIQIYRGHITRSILAGAKVG